MLVSIETLKEYLGLPDTEDPVVDPVLERSSTLAQSLIEAYLDMPLEMEGAAPRTQTFKQLSGVKVVRLQNYPVSVSAVTIDGVAVTSSEYTVDSRLGVVEFTQQRASILSLAVTYKSGYSPEDVPSDISNAIANIALTLYENGGKFAVQSSAGSLKSMTMFDAMSMSFETGAGGEGPPLGSPESLVMQWAFVLDKYKVDKYVMG